MMALPDLLGAPDTRDFKSYSKYLAQYVLTMFDWDADFAPWWAFEYLLTTRGHCGVFLNGGNPVVAAGAYAGEPDIYGFGTKYIGNDLRGNKYTGTVGVDVAVIWNNVTLTPDTHIIGTYAQRYVETDKSILNVLRGARITALVTASDNTDSATLDRVINAINAGDTVVKVPPVYREIDALDSGAKRFDVLRLTDPKDTDKLQYLCRYRDDLLAAFMGEYGVDVNVVNKGSQVSRDELHSMENAVGAIVANRLKCRREALELIRGWGYKINVRPALGRTTEKELNAVDTVDNNTADGGELDTNSNNGQ